MRRLKTAVVLACLVPLAQASVFAQGKVKTGLQSLPGAAPKIEDKDPKLTYDFDLANEKFFIAVPVNYTGAQPFGILVFISPSDAITAVPAGWNTVLQAMKLIFVAPQAVGNKQPAARRAGLAVVGACKMFELARIDTNRVYVAGFSGGARMASHAAFSHPRLFSGVFSICGVDFCRKVDRVKATETDDYGHFSIDDKRAEDARNRVKFALVTGSQDFRYGNILDIYAGGFLKDGYGVRLFDVPGMGHSMCPAKVLNDALKFIEDRKAGGSKPRL